MSAEGTLARLRADVRASRDTDRTGSRDLLGTAARLLFTTRLQSVVLLRGAQWLGAVLPPAALLLKYANSVLTGADIAPQASIGGGLRLFHPVGVVIGPDCRVGANCTLMQGATLGAGVGGSPTIGDDVYVGAGAKVFGAITVGDGCVIGANAVVMQTMPPRCFVAGVPAKVIGPIRPPGSDPRAEAP